MFCGNFQLQCWQLSLKFSNITSKMSIKKLAAWFLTDSGKNFSFCCAATATVGALFAKTVPETLLINYYVDIVRLYMKGVSVPTSEGFKKIFEKAMELVGIPERERKSYEPFAAYGFEIFSLGTAYSKFGCKVGLPKNFSYTDVNFIDKSIIKINNEPILWELEEAQQLLHSLVLSDKAQLYAMAREIKMGESPKFLLDSLYPVTSIIGVYGLSQGLNKKFNMYVKPRGMRMCIYFLVVAFMYGNYIFAKDYTQVYYEKTIDEFLKQKDPIFVEGGQEFYEKILNRNIALRKLLGGAGERKFSALGNENYLFRNRHIPLVHRKEFFEGKTDYKNWA